jgi:hypothetical protein
MGTISKITERLDRLGDRAPRDPFDNGGSGGDDGGMEARVAKLEATVEHIQRDLTDIKQDVREIRSSMSTDFRLTWGGLIALALGLAGLMAKGFHWL